MTQLSPYLQLTTLAYLAGKHTGDTFHVYIYDNDGKRFSLTRNGHFIARGVPLQEAKDLLLLFIPDELKGQTTKKSQKNRK